MDFVKASVAMFRDAHRLKHNLGDRLRVKTEHVDRLNGGPREGVVVVCCPEHGGYLFRLDDGRQGGWGESELEPIPGPCERCGATEGVEWECSRTAYDTSSRRIEPSGENDPNRDQALCRSCAKEHHEYWDDMWANVEYL